MSEAITLKEIHTDLLALKKDMKEIKEYLAESDLELSDAAKAQIRESRRRDRKEFLSQEEVERKFL